mmetsp:Transcript_29024/g.42823  ORF Transcript_29024/g.42823 Transcript_29024/m.42823 type:complete len:569 (+) Transcript_29024:129-1835(+)|eukprot:CAMPEP_0194210406 /NCGR_PEP_ID=MMETSP0156-20130528/8403_1 /TAXON_ID=33649 /ORGANISM="Thalassionema nitzschioides, Strain L26-B" /LENGTH=568 /DNA_ID=CAMNT_0038937745 /DNA_START=35 /DNA_END=1741 /DNA_ORIENTATION=-
MSNITLADLCAEGGGGDESICELFASTTGISEGLASVTNGLDAFFLLFAGAVVFLMQAGFAMLCAGSVREKNVRNIMLKNLLDACGGALGFFFCGYAVAYGSPEGKTAFLGSSNFLLLDDAEATFDDGSSDIGSKYIGFFFQFAFAATAATIVAGTVAERCKMAAYLCYSVFLTAFVYPVVVHSTWSSQGFLSAFNSGNLFFDTGVIDFAGSGVVHLTGGATALIAAIILGPRIGRFYDENGNKLSEPADFQGHSAALQVLGTFILWFGWYGFNPGSALLASPAGYHNVIGLAAVTTTLSAAAGCVSSMALDTTIEAMRTGEISYDLTMAMNGCLGGLVAITAGCSVIQPWMSVIVGVIGGFVYYAFSKFLIFMRIDDAVDAVPVHFANGIWGVIAVGLFSDPVLQDLTYGSADAHVGWVHDFSDPMLLAAQCIQVGFIIAWVTVCMVPFFVFLRCVGLFRVDPLEEEVGLDVSHHRGTAYNFDGVDDNAKEKFENSRKGSNYALGPPTEQAPPPQQYPLAPAPAPVPYAVPPQAPAGPVYGGSVGGGSYGGGSFNNSGYTSSSDQSA